MVAVFPVGALITDVLLEVNVVELVTSEPFRVAVNVIVLLDPTIVRLMSLPAIEARGCDHVSR